MFNKKNLPNKNFRKKIYPIKKNWQKKVSQNKISPKKNFAKEIFFGAIIILGRNTTYT